MHPHQRPDSRRPAPNLPRRFAGRYEIVRWLGEGGMGTVYLARDEKFDRLIALKVLLGGEPEQLARFKQEFRTLANIGHPNLITLHELLCEGETWLFTMDYVEGRDFLSHVSAVEAREAPTLLDTDAYRSREFARYAEVSPRSPLRSEPLLRRVLLQLTDAIRTLHAAGKLHLDLKPSNVLVDANDHVTVLDFGLARDLNQSDDASDRLLGTPAYMAPEHAVGKSFEPASDWYGVGVMLYEALTGRLPFEGPVAHILLSKTAHDPDPPSALCREVPRELEALCMHLLAREPAARAGAAEIMSTLGVHALTTRRAALPSFAPREAFVGRERLLERLGELSRRSGSRIALLHGRSGLGKTTLLKRFTQALASDPRTLLLYGACHERETMPYKAFDGPVDALLEALSKLPGGELAELLPPDAHTLVRLFPAFAALTSAPPLDEEEDAELGRARAFRAFGELFSRLCGRYTVVLAIDDLHWSDVDSALLMRALFERRSPALFLIGSYDSERGAHGPLLSVLRELPGTGVAVHVQDEAVEELGRSEAEELARELLAAGGAESAALSAEIAREAHGIPRFIHELVRYVGESEAPLPRVSLRELLRQRIAALPANAGELLTALSVAGSPTAQRVVFRAAGLASGEGAALHMLRVAGLAQSRGARPEDPLQTAHEHIRAVVLESLSEEQKRPVHMRLVDALAREPVPDEEQLYRHSLAAGLNERALGHALRAAERAQRALASHRSAELYRAALALEAELATRDDALRSQLLEGLGDALAATARCRDAGEKYLEAAALREPGARATLERKAADQLLRGGDLARGTELLARVLERVQVRYPKSAEEALAALRAQRKLLHARGLAFEERPPEGIPAEGLERLASLKISLGVYWLVEPVRGALFATMYLREALDLGHQRHILRGIETEAAYLSLVGGAKAEARAQELYTAARLLTAKIGRASTERGYKLAEAGFHAMYGRKQKSTECALASLASEQKEGAGWERAYARFHIYQNTLYIGGRAELASEVAEHVAEADARRDRFSAATLLPMLALAHLQGDEPQRAAQALASMRTMLSEDVFSFLDLQELIWSALTDLYVGDHQGAIARYERAAPRYELSGMPRLSTWRLLHQWGVMLAHLAALAAGEDPALHAAAAERCIRAIERERIAWPRPFASMGRAALAQQKGETFERDALLDRAVAESEALGYWPFARLFARSRALFRGDAALARELDRELAALGIAAPARWHATWAPGLLPIENS